MASDAHTADRRRLLNLIAIVGAALATGLGSLLASVAYASMTAHQQDAARARQDAVIAQLRGQQLAACAFARDLGTAPMPDVPKPGRLGVVLVTDSRAWWRANHCPGDLPVPSGLAKWAAAYRIPVDGKAS